MSAVSHNGGRWESVGLILLLALWLIPVIVSAGDAYPNLVPNFDFKDGLEKWQSQFPFPNESKYNDNHEFVKAVSYPKRAGKVVELALNAKTAASEGVKVSSAMIPIEKGKYYEFGADVFSEGPTSKIFLEGYKVDPEQQAEGDNQYKGYVRCFRAVIHVKDAGGRWATQRMIMDAPLRYQPTHVMIKLYGYYPAGKLYYSNVYLRLTDDVPKKKAGERISPSSPKKDPPTPQ
jgi:hypothetical protein